MTHGTNSAYQAGCRCQPCRDAHAEYMRGYQQRRRRFGNQEAWKLADELLDRLSLDGGWLTSEGLAMELDRHVESMDRILRRLRREGTVESRIVELAGTHRDQRTEWRAV